MLPPLLSCEEAPSINSGSLHTARSPQISRWERRGAAVLLMNLLSTGRQPRLAFPDSVYIKMSFDRASKKETPRFVYCALDVEVEGHPLRAPLHPASVLPRPAAQPRPWDARDFDSIKGEAFFFWELPKKVFSK